MKKVLFSLMALAIALTACKKEEQIVPEIKADKTEINVPVTGTEDAEEDVFIVFTANVDWTASVQNAEWLTITPAKGTPEKGKIKLIAEASTEKDPRTAVVVVTAGTAKKEFKVIQGQVDAFSLVEETASIDSKGGEVSLKVMTNIPYNVTIPAEATWVKEVTTKAYGEQVTKLSVEAYSGYEPRTAEILVSAEGFEPLTFIVNQTGRASVSWIKKPATDWTGFTPANGARLAILGDNLLVGNDNKVLVINPTDGTYSQTINVPDGFSVKSLCVDDGGNVIIAADAPYKTMLRIYTLKSLEQEPRLLMEYNTENIYCSAMGNVRVKGNIEKNAVVTVSVSVSQYWLAWEIVNGFVSEPKRGPIDKWGTIWNVACMCVAPVSASLSDGLWAVGYIAPYALFRCTDVTANTWENAFQFNSAGNENFNNISTVMANGKNYIAALSGCHFTYSQMQLYVLESTANAVNSIYTLNCRNQANWVEDGVDVDGKPKYTNKDWTGAGTFSDVCMVEKGGVLYIYYIDAQFGVAGCVKLG